MSERGAGGILQDEEEKVPRGSYKEDENCEQHPSSSHGTTTVHVFQGDEDESVRCYEILMHPEDPVVVVPISHQSLRKGKAFLGNIIALVRPKSTMTNDGYKVVIRYHAVVDEKHPFELYALEVHSPFSRRIVRKQTFHFREFQDRVTQGLDNSTLACRIR